MGTGRARVGGIRTLIFVADRKTRSTSMRTLGIVICCMPLFACVGTRPSDLGVTDGRLAPCPPSPNCVCSDAGDAAHAIPPLELSGTSPAPWDEIVTAVSELPRTTSVTQRDGYLHAECQSAVFGFVDDLELELRPEQGIVAIRSASRLGYGDLGVNRRRVESLRAALSRRGLVR